MQNKNQIDENFLLSSWNFIKQKEYWINKLSGDMPETILLAREKCDPGISEENQKKIDFYIPSNLCSKLTRLCNDSDLSIYIVLLTVLKILVLYYTNNDDIIVISPIFKPNLSDETINNTLFVRDKVTGNLSFKELLIRVRQSVLESYENQDYPWEKLMEYFGDIPKNNDIPFSNILCLFKGIHGHEKIGKNSNLLAFAFEKNGSQIIGSIEYNSSVYEPEYVKQIPAHFLNILEAALISIDTRISDISVISEEEKARLLSIYNSSVAEYPKNKTIHELFYHQVQKTPDRIAVDFKDQQISYHALNERSNQLARFLRKKGIGMDCIVGVLVDRSLEMMIGVLGILKAGGAYLPLDNNYPIDRIMGMLKDSHAQILLTCSTLFDQNAIDCEIIEMEDLNLFLGEKEDLEPGCTSRNLAYVIFTSGSTGKPNGVMIEHSSLINFLFSLNDQFGRIFNPDDRCLSLTNISFDVSVGELFLPIVFGSRLLLMPSEDIYDLEKISNIILEKSVTFAYIPPTLLKEVYEEMRLSGVFVGLNKILVGVEPIKDYVLESYVHLNPSMQIINGYGPTESTICATFYKYQPSEPVGKNVPIGRPLPNTIILIINSADSILPLGVPGELCISGAGLARGYLNRPELTAKKFIKSPHVNGNWVYRTGDQAKWRMDGNIEFLGRIDHQVKIRGYRIELGEIEKQLSIYPEIKEVLVIVKEPESMNDGSGLNDKYLCAYYVSENLIPSVELRAHLAKNLPEFMIPSYFIRIEKIPLTPSCKIDRKALPSPQLKADQQYIAPENDVEEKLVEIWSKVLGINKDSIGVYDNFFELGGHSLKSTILISKIHKELQVKVPLVQIFTTPTIRELAEFIKESEENLYSSLKPVEEKECYPLSPAQRRLYFLHQLVQNNIGYNISQLLILDHNANLKRVEETFKKLIIRHESLRTSFIMVDGNAVQRVHHIEDIDFLVEFITDDGIIIENTIKEREALILRLIKPFDLSKAPLIRVSLISTNGGRKLLLIDLHHIIVDGTSHKILEQEFMSLYASKDLPPLKIQYKDFSEWQNSPEVEEILSSQEKYWLLQFSDEIPLLQLPVDFVRPQIQNFEGNFVNFTLMGNDYAGLKRYVKEMNSTLFILLLSLFNIFLSKLSGSEDIIVGVPTAGRRHSDLENIIGMFVNTIALRNYPCGQKRVNEFLEEVKKCTLVSFENQEYPFENLVEKISLKRDLSRNPLFDVMFNLLNQMDYNDDLLEEIRDEKENYYHQKRSSKFDMMFNVVEFRDGMLFSLEYSTILFKPETIDRFIAYFKHLISSFNAGNNQTIFELNIIPEQEKYRLLFQFNNTPLDCSQEKTLYQLFEDQAARSPHHVALIYREIAISYSELNKRANQLTYQLKRYNVNTESIVSLLLERSLEMIIGILGILKVGAAYLPINLEVPQKRLHYMLEDSDSCVLLTNTNLENTDLLPVLNVIRLDNPSQWSEDSPGLVEGCTSTSLAYVIYTSGSTGIPKGVLVEQKGVVSLLYTMQDLYPIDPLGAYLLKTNYVFDVSVTEIFGWILGGGKLVILEPGMEKDPFYVLQVIARYGITHVNFVPSQLNTLLMNTKESIEPSLKTLKYLLTAGEAFSLGLLKKSRILPSLIRVENIYGPTEGTVYSTAYRCDHSSTLEIVPIGKPINNVTAFILDKWKRLIPTGVTGELCIGGVGVARGYLNNPELTAEKFVIVDFSNKDRLYRTGDLCRWLPDGNIEFLGRFDHQVKIRGYRIELGEIENRLTNHPSVKDAILMTKEDEIGDKSIWAYVVADQHISISVLRSYLADQVPGYMIPAHFIFLDYLPLNPSGKVDRQKLIQLEAIEINDDATSHFPQTPLQKEMIQIWQSVIGKRNIGLQDDFFLVGGDSIKAIQIISRMARAGYILEMKDLFLHHTISKLESRVKKRERIPDQSTIFGEVPLSPIQREFFQKHRCARHHYNHAMMFFSPEGFNIDEVYALFMKLTEHHDALRMTFREDGDLVVQYNNGFPFSVSIKEYDLRGIVGVDVGQELLKKTNSVQASIDLKNGPLMRLAIFHLNDGDRLLIVIHHLVIDGVSWRILFEDLETLHQQYRKGERLSLPLKSDSYKYWSEQLIQYAGSDTLLKEKQYWKNIESHVVPSLPRESENDDKVNRVSDGISLSFRLNREETEKLLTRVNEPYRTEVNDILLSGFGLALKRTLRMEKVLVALEGHGREEIIKGVDVHRTVGWFTSVYPVVLDLSYENDLSRQIKEIKETLRKVPNKGIGYGILKYLGDEKIREDINFHLTPQVSFNYLGQFDADVEQMSSFRVARESVGVMQGLDGERDFDIEFLGMVSQGQLVITIIYNKRHYSSTTIASLMESYNESLSNIISHCCLKKEIEITPSDLTYRDISIEMIEELSRRYDGRIEDIYPLSPMQEGMFFHWLYDRSSAVYFEQFSYRLHWDMNISYIELSLKELVNRHTTLRTNFLFERIDRPLQIVLKEQPIDFNFQDIRFLCNKKDKEDFIIDFKEKDRRLGFDLTKDILIRVSILQVEEAEYEFIWGFHHILMDGWCIGILVSEFLEIYKSLLEDHPYRLSPVTPFRNYIQWLESQNKQDYREYWRKYLENYEKPSVIPVLEDTKTKENGYKTREFVFPIHEEKSERLRYLAGKYHVTLNTVVQVIWGILLGKYNGVEDVVFGSVVSGRPFEIEGVESMIGLFVNTIPVRIRCEGKTPCNELLQKTQQNDVESKAFHYFPLADIQADTILKHHLIDHIYAFENYPAAERVEDLVRKNDTAMNIKLSRIQTFEQSNYAFNIVIGAESFLNIKFIYDENVFGNQGIRRLADHFVHILDQLTSDEEQHIDEIELALPTEKEDILYRLNDTRVDYPSEKSLIQLFEENAALTPLRVALVSEDIHLTYSHLSEMSYRFASQLIKYGVKPGVLVSLVMERSLQWVIGILGIIKAGGAYLPIEPGVPLKRILYILRDSAASVLITTHTLYDSLNQGVVHDLDKKIVLLKITDLIADPQEEFHVNLPVYPGGSILAYIMFTSGSTGRPKGVLVEHRNVVRLVKNTNFIQFIENDCLITTGAPDFDASTLEVWGPLLNGSSMVPAKKEDILDSQVLKELIRKYRITMMWMTSPLFNQMSDLDIEIFNGIRLLIVGGDVLSPIHINRLLEFYPGIQIVNGYGPTENTTFSVTHPVSMKYHRPIPIGRPINNSTAYVVDKNRHLLPVGVAGELYVGGDGVARGYLNNPDLTDEKFGVGLFKDGERFYKTGDIARFCMDETIEYIGRIDHQIKIRGYRIELGEIESCLLKHKEIKEAVVNSREDLCGDKYLCAYIVPRNPGYFNEQELRDYLGAILPLYAIPSFFIEIENIPLNSSGKVDRKALTGFNLKNMNDYVEPQTKLEKRIKKIWSSSLGISEEIIGINSNFFQLGGHSLKAIVTSLKIHKELDVVVPLEIFFKNPTIRELSNYIENASKERFIPIEKVEEKAYYSLSSEQKRLFIQQQKVKDNISYHVPMIITLDKSIDIQRLELSIKKLIQRHEILRTSFHFVDEGSDPVQVVHQDVPFSIEYIQDSAGELGENLEGVNELLNAFFRPFDFSRAPIFRVGVIDSIKVNRRVLIVDINHIITDGTSQNILRNELISLYNGENLEPLSLQYKDYAEWQSKWLDSEKTKKQEKFWLSEFEGEIPLLHLPYNFSRPAKLYFEGSSMNFHFDEQETMSLREMALSTNTTMYMILISIYYLFLAKLSRQEDIIIGTAASSRRHENLQNVIGFFVNTIALRNFPKGEKTFRNFLLEVKGKTLKAFENQDYQFEYLVEKLGINRAADRNPLFDVMFALQNFDSSFIGVVDSEIRDESITPIQIKHDRTSKFDLLLIANDSTNKLFFTLEYNTKLFLKESIERFIKYIREIVKAVCGNMDIKLKDIKISHEFYDKKIDNPGIDFDF